MKKGMIYSHQAWTDTINLLSLPGYYAKKYNLVKVTVIDKMYENVRFALTGKKSLYSYEKLIKDTISDIKKIITK